MGAAGDTATSIALLLALAQVAVLAVLAVLAVVLAAVHRPLGDHMARTFTTQRDLAVERGLYRVIGVDPRGE